jgi:predicted transposase YdaD
MNLPQLRIIYLEDYQDKEGESLALDLVRLLSCDKQETMKVACQLVNHYDVNTDVLNLIETILVYKIPRMSREEIRKMFELSEVDVTKSRYYQDAMQEALENTTVKKLQLKNPSLYQEMMDKGVNKGITQGVTQGITQGMNEGLDKGMRLMLKQGLIHRFGELVPEIEQRLELANAEKINKWFFRSFDVESLEDIFDESND